MKKRLILTPLLLVFSILWLNCQTTDLIDKNYRKEIAKLGKSKITQSAFDTIEALEPQTGKDLIMLTEIPAPPFMEGERAKKFKAMLEEAGASKLWMDEVGNVLALKKGKAIDYFTKDASRFTTKGPKTSYNVGRIGGVTSVNSIPFESWMGVDMRSADPESLKQIDVIFNALV